MRISTTIVALLLAGTAAVQASAVTIGTDPDNGPSTANCAPFGCGGSAGYSFYQQIYNASAFAGPLTIDTVSFAGDAGYPGVMDTNSYSIRFYLSTRTAATLTTNLASNRGTLLSDFGSYSLSGPVPTTLSFTGKSFSYDPSQGSLLMEVSLGTPSFFSLYSGQAAGYFSADPSRTVTASTTDFFYVSPVGLVTTFTSATAAVPEPATWAMMIAGFGLVGGAMRRRNNATISLVA